MTVENYFLRMKALGYPSPSLSLTHLDDGTVSGCAQWRGGISHSLSNVDQETVIDNLFTWITKDGKPFKAVAP